MTTHRFPMQNMKSQFVTRNLVVSALLSSHAGAPWCSLWQFCDWVSRARECLVPQVGGYILKTLRHDLHPYTMCLE